MVHAPQSSKQGKDKPLFGAALAARNAKLAREGQPATGVDAMPAPQTASKPAQAPIPPSPNELITVHCFNKTVDMTQREFDRVIAATRGYSVTIMSILAKLLVNGKAFMDVVEVRDEVVKMAGGSFTEAGMELLLSKTSTRCSQLWAAGKLHRTPHRVANKFGYYHQRSLARTVEALDPDAGESQRRYVARAVMKKGHEVEDINKALANCTFKQLLEIHLDVAAAIERHSNLLIDEHAHTTDRLKTLEKTLIKFRKMTAVLDEDD